MDTVKRSNGQFGHPVWPPSAIPSLRTVHVIFIRQPITAQSQPQGRLCFLLSISRFAAPRTFRLLLDTSRTRKKSKRNLKRKRKLDRKQGGFCFPLQAFHTIPSLYSAQDLPARFGNLSRARKSATTTVQQTWKVHQLVSFFEHCTTPKPPTPPRHHPARQDIRAILFIRKIPK